MRFSARALLGLVALSQSVAAASFSNYIRPNNGGDPDIQYQDGYYYLMSTNYADLRQTRATTLEGLKTGEERLVRDPSSDDVNARCQVWAPEQHLIDGIWYIYYAAGPCNNWNVNDQRTYVLKGGASLWDPFTLLGKVNTPFFAIDATRLSIAGKTYFVYSCMRSDTGATLASLCIADMSDPLTIGEEILLTSPLAAWECVGGSCVDEGPHALYHNGKTFLTFAAGACYSPDYALGLMTYKGGDPLDAASWNKEGGPVFQGTANVTSAGHNSFLKSPDGTEDYIVFHSTTNKNGGCGNDRVVNAQKVNYDSNGNPAFGEPVSPGVSMPGPSGE